MFKLLHTQIPPSTRPETLLVSKVAEGKIRLEIWTVVGLLAAFSLGSSSQAQAQESISIENASATGEAVPVEDSATSLEPISGDDAALDSNGATEVAGFSEEVQKRFLPEALAIRLAIGGIYDDNIFQTRVREESDVVLQGQIGILLRTPKEAKSQLALNYDATSFWYLDHPRLDAVNHAVSLNGTMELGRTQLVMSGNYQRVAGGEQALLHRSVSSSASSNDTSNPPSLWEADRATFGRSSWGGRNRADSPVARVDVAAENGQSERDNSQGEKEFCGRGGFHTGHI